MSQSELPIQVYYVHTHTVHVKYMQYRQLQLIERFIHCYRRYFVRVVVVRRISDLVKEHDIAVHTLSTYPDLINR